MNILRRGALPLFLVVILCAVSVYFYAEDRVITVLSKPEQQKTVIIDAGHAALENTID